MVLVGFIFNEKLILFLYFFRFEGSVFFVYDHKVLQKEVDLLEDAIVYFYPHTVRIIQPSSIASIYLFQHLL